jgi:hypothetical protein
MGRPKKVVIEEATPKKVVKKTPPKKVVKAAKSERDKITRAKAIKLQCIECMGFQKALVKDCTDYACPIWPYRKGYGQEYTDIPIRK